MEKTKAIFLLLLHCSLLSSTSGFSSGPVEGHTINGRVKIEGVGAKGIGVGWKASNVKIILNGGESVTFVRPDGYFSFSKGNDIDVLLSLGAVRDEVSCMVLNERTNHNVPAGTHLIEVAAMGYFFSPVRVDVSARNRGKVQAALTETRRGLSELVLEPLREEQYYEIREPFSVMSLLKSPMGLMLGFMVLVMFVMPKLVDGMDPEEIKRAQEEMRQGVPSLSNLLPRSN